MTQLSKKQKRALEDKGWKVGTVEEFLDLTPEEVAYIELKLALGDLLKSLRKKRSITQAELAYRLGSSQPRIARMEKGDPSVSIDLIIRSLLAMGASKNQLAKTIRT